jgi:CrcB protein
LAQRQETAPFQGDGKKQAAGAIPVPSPLVIRFRRRKSPRMLNYLLVALGGALGSVARYGATGLVARCLGEAFPWGTLLVNISGSFAIGLFATLATEGRWLMSPATRVFFTAGICGGFTTFSAFSLQTLDLARQGAWLYAGLNILGSVALCLLFVWLGYFLATTLNR